MLGLGDSGSFFLFIKALRRFPVSFEVVLSSVTSCLDLKLVALLFVYKVEAPPSHCSFFNSWKLIWERALEEQEGLSLSEFSL